MKVAAPASSVTSRKRATVIEVPACSSRRSSEEMRGKASSRRSSHGVSLRLRCFSSEPMSVPCRPADRLRKRFSSRWTSGPL